MTAKGKKLTVVEMGAELAPEGYRMHRGWLLQRLEPAADCRTGYRCVKVAENGVYCLDENGSEQFLPADTVLYALGMKARSDVVESLRAAAPGSFAVIGDCMRPGKVKEAVHEGWFAIDLIASGK